MSAFLSRLLFVGVVAFVGAGVLLWRHRDECKKADKALRTGNYRKYVESCGTVDWR